MDNERFDAFTRTLAGRRSRRGMLTAAAGALAAAVGLRREAAAQILPPGWPWTGIPCGGIAALPCPAGFTCEIPWNAPPCEADCMGWCRADIGDGVPTNPCAAITCAVDSTCCPNCGGICVPAGTACSDDLCVDGGAGGDVCGPTVCAPGQTCCNASCGYCTWPGEACTEEFCVSEPCGPNVCGLGEFCCNESCGICAPIGGGCTLQLCIEEPAGEPCGPTVCAAGEVCCNESCGICTPPDGFCTQQFCG